MGKFIHAQNSFALGEIAPEFFARSDLSVASRGLSKLENMDVLASGAIARRRATAKIAPVAPEATLIPFSISDSENFLLALSDGHLKIYDGGSGPVPDLITPWDSNSLGSLQYAQRFGTMIFVHPDFQPRVLKRVGNSFSLSLFEFSANDDMSKNMPFMKFDDTANVKITVTTKQLCNLYRQCALLDAGKRWRSAAADWQTMGC